MEQNLSGATLRKVAKIAEADVASLFHMQRRELMVLCVFEGGEFEEVNQ